MSLNDTTNKRRSTISNKLCIDNEYIDECVSATVNTPFLLWFVSPIKIKLKNEIVLEKSNSWLQHNPEVHKISKENNLSRRNR